MQKKLLKTSFFIIVSFVMAKESYAGGGSSRPVDAFADECFISSMIRASQTPKEQHELEKEYWEDPSWWNGVQLGAYYKENRVKRDDQRYPQVHPKYRD